MPKNVFNNLTSSVRNFPTFFKPGGNLPTCKIVNDSKRKFNAGTLNNVCLYLQQNREKIQWERNESGFIRTVFPQHVFQPDPNIPPLVGGEKLRANFWYYESPVDSMGDESVHDHPRPFQSYIVNGGYEHEIYSVKNENDLIQQFACVNSISSEELKEMIKLQQNITGLSSYHQFVLDKNQSEKVSYKGEVALKMDKIEATKTGDIVSIDDKMIHRVSKFRTNPTTPTASLNIVRDSGKGVTNIFLPSKKESAVKTTREILSPQEALKATDAMLEITENHLSMGFR